MAKRKRKRTEAPIDGDQIIDGEGDGDLNSKPEKHDCNRKSKRRKRTEAPTSGDGGGNGDGEEIHDGNRKRKRRKRTEAPTGGDGNGNGDGEVSRKPQKPRYRDLMQLKGDKMIASVLGDNRIEDVQWLCSLSESELDMLIFLKMMVLRRAKKTHIGFPADKIDLKVLRDMSITMMKNVKEELKKDHLAPSCDCEAAESWKQIDESKLSQVDVKELSSMTREELWPFIRPNITQRSSWDK